MNKVVFGVAFVIAGIFILYITKPENLQNSKKPIVPKDTITAKVSNQNAEQLPIEEGLSLKNQSSVGEVSAKKREGKQVLDNVPSQDEVSVSNSALSGVDITSSQDALSSRYKFEARSTFWAEHWENELNTIVLFSGSKAPIKDTKISCKTTICEVSVSFLESGAKNTTRALSSLSQEFANRKLTLAPASINPKTGEVVFYTKPGAIN